MRHAAEEMMLHHRRVPGMKEVHIVRALHKADVRHRMNEVGRLSHHSVGGHGTPELLRVLELLKDVQRPVNGHSTALIACRCVAELTDARVSRARVVPAVRGFTRQFGRDFEHLDAQTRIEPLEHHGQRRGHDAAADKHDVGRFNDARCDAANRSDLRGWATRSAIMRTYLHGHFHRPDISTNGHPAPPHARRRDCGWRS